MSKLPETLWINTNPSFKRFEQPLIRYLAHYSTVAQWEYIQTQDEASSLDVALVLLHDYLKSCNRTVNLVGHGTGGLLGLLYARRYPERVQSLTLLGVGSYPAIDWQAHYYRFLELLPCSRQILLAQMVRLLFGHQNHYTTNALIEVLEQDLRSSPSPHSLYKRASIAAGGVSTPLMACGSAEDLIVEAKALRRWHAWLKEGDVLWECPRGYHFFHYFYPHQTGRQIVKFWRSLSEPAPKKHNVLLEVGQV